MTGIVNSCNIGLKPGTAPMTRSIIIILLCSLATATSHAQQRPNIIFIIADDVSQNDIGCYGNPDVQTPHLNRLAKEGIRLSNFFVTSSSCSPSRTSIITGRYPHNTGAAELHSPLPPSLPLFPEELKKNGYYTALLGKWHEGPATRRAYDTVIAGPKLNGPGGEAQWLTALKNRPPGQPFFFWLSPFDAHRDWSAGSEATRHDPAVLKIPSTLLDTKATRADLAAYYDEIGRLDRHIGLLLQELEKQGIADSTLIVFTADNARPFPGAKTRLYARGTKSPLIIRWPGGIKTKEKTSPALVSSIDLAPTLLELAGVKPPATVQGRSFARLLQQAAQPFRRYLFSEHNWHDYEAFERAVLDGRFQYIRNSRPALNNTGAIDVNQSPAAQDLYAAWQQGALSPLQADPFIQPRAAEELYDLQTDPLQTRNLAADKKYKPELERLRKVLDTWQEETKDSLPASLTPDWYHRVTGAPLETKGNRGTMPGAGDAVLTNAKGPF